MTSADRGEVLDWRALRPGLVRFLAKRTGCTAIAEDLVQDLWMRMSAARPVADELRSPVAYLFRAAANLATDHARAERRRAAANTEAMALVMDGLDAAPSPEQAVVDLQDYARVTVAIAALPPRTRQIFAMNRLDGVSYRRIAAELGISATAVEKHMKRALDALAGMRDAPDDSDPRA